MFQPPWQMFDVGQKSVGKGSLGTAAESVMDAFEKKRDMESKLASAVAFKSLTTDMMNPLQKEKIQSEIALNKARTTQAMPLGGSGTFSSGMVGDMPTGEEFLKTLSPQEQNLVTGLANYKLDPARTFGLRNDLRSKYISATQQYDPTFDMSQYVNRQKVNQDFTSGKTSAKITAFNTAIKHLDTLYNAVENTPNSPIPQFNKLQRAMVSGLQNKSPMALSMVDEGSALTAISGELANVFKQTGATDQEIEAWVNNYKLENSIPAKKQYIKTGINLLKGRLEAFNEQYERGVGRPYGGELISSNSQQIIDKIMGSQTGGGTSQIEQDASEIRKRIASGKYSSQIVQAMKDDFKQEHGVDFDGLQ